MGKNKITIEITANGWKTDVTINGKTYSERMVADDYGSECVEGNLEEETGIPDSICEVLNNFFCFDCQQALLKYENEEVEYEAIGNIHDNPEWLKGGQQ